jgi:hypothetical protein
VTPPPPPAPSIAVAHPDPSFTGELDASQLRKQEIKRARELQNKVRGLLTTSLAPLGMRPHFAVVAIVFIADFLL